MARISWVKSFFRTEREGVKVTDVKVDPGAGANVTPHHYAGPGDDSAPLPSDRVVIVRDLRTGVEVAVGYLDPKSPQKAVPGEFRGQARNAAGDEVAQIWLKKTGEAILSNALGSAVLGAAGSFLFTMPLSTLAMPADGSFLFTGPAGTFGMDAAGLFNANGVTIDAADVMDVPLSLFVDSKELADHDHKAGTPPGDTGPNQ